MSEVVLDFGTAANFATVMGKINNWNATTSKPKVTNWTFKDGSSIFMNVIGTTFTYNTSTKTWTANSGYWVRLRWNTDDNHTIGPYTLSQIKTFLTNNGVTIYPLAKYLANGSVDTTYTCPQWGRIL